MLSYFLSFALFLMPFAFQQSKVVDQILMLVNDDVITRSDVIWSLAIDPNAPNPAEGVSSDLLKQKLDVLIGQQLILQEALRIPSADISQDEVRKKLASIIASFKNEAAFRQRVEAVGLNSEKLEELTRRQLIIDKFVEFRFETFVLVTEQEIQDFYEKNLVPEIKKRGAVPPPVAEVHDMISQRLKVEKVNMEIDRWLEESRQRAELVLLAEP